MAKRMGATVRTVPSSHGPMVSHPKEVVDLITQAAESGGVQVIRKPKPSREWTVLPHTSAYVGFR